MDMLNDVIKMFGETTIYYEWIILLLVNVLFMSRACVCNFLSDMGLS